MIVYLLPIGRDRFELYSEPPEDPAVSPPGAAAGRVRRWMHVAGVRWHALVESARLDAATGRFGRWRDALIRRLAESIAGQRTLWTLTSHARGTLLYPSSRDTADARRALDRALVIAGRHHGVWAAIDFPLFVVSAVLAPIPGPNVAAYYLAFRVVGHWLSWRGARYGRTRVAWTFEPDGSLAELSLLAGVPRAARAERVEAIAARLHLHRLSAFFDRVAA